MRSPVSRLGAAVCLLVATVSLTSAATTLSAPTRIKVDADGGYSGIVVKIDKDVPEEECGRILASLKVRLKNRSLPYSRSPRHSRSLPTTELAGVMVFFLQWKFQPSKEWKS